MIRHPLKVKELIGILNKFDKEAFVKMEFYHDEMPQFIRTVYDAMNGAKENLVILSRLNEKELEE